MSVNQQHDSNTENAADSDDDDNISVDKSHDAQEVDETPQMDQLSHSYLKPLEVLYQLSGYPHLLRLYWILVTRTKQTANCQKPP